MTFYLAYAKHFCRGVIFLCCMKIGIYTYGTRGDVQPYIALALGLQDRGHEVVLAAPSDFKDFVEGFGVRFFPLYGNAEAIMNSPEGQSVLKTENSIQLMKFFFQALSAIKVPLRESYFASISTVDYIIANSATLPIVSTIAEKQGKKMALTYFMPPVVPTREFPLGDFDFLDFGCYNQLTYKIAHRFYWKFVKAETNEYRQELGLAPLRKNLVQYIDHQKLLDLYCISPTLIPQPKDWAPHHKITGFLTVPAKYREQHPLEQTPEALSKWLTQGEKPLYLGFGSNGVGNHEKFSAILSHLLTQTQERILFCTGWSQFKNLPDHPNLFVTKYVNHEAVLPYCKVGVFHGGAGTLATILRHNLPVVIISFYTDQPTWGKIIEKKKLGLHIPVKKLDALALLEAIKKVQTEAIKSNVLTAGQLLRSEQGLENALRELEQYFGQHQQEGS